jgi:PAS domain S-box-containing protein
MSTRIGKDLARAPRAAQRMSEAETELFENTFRHSPIGMALVSLDGKFLRINEAFRAILGYSLGELLVCDFQTITHPDDLEADLEALGRLVRGETRHYQMDKRYIRADGAEVWANLSVSLVTEADGRPKHFVSQVQDLTARRAAEAALKASEAHYRLIAENTTDMIVAADLRGRVTFVTPSCRNVIGYDPEALLGLEPAQFCHPDDLAALTSTFYRLARHGRADRVRWRLRHRDGERWIWLESNPSLLRANGPIREGVFLDVVRDVTAQVAQDQALARATAAAEAATAAKSEFLANMSHEIRTPLTAVIGFSGLLAERPDLDEAARSHVQRVASAGRALLSLVNDILDFSKLEAGQYEVAPQAVCPVEVAKDALMMIAAQASVKGLSLDFVAAGDMPAFVSLDPERVRQVLLNLVGNAVKFTETGGVTLTLAHDAAAGRLRVTVSDTGLGLDAGQQAKLFQRFSQVDTSPSRRHGGSGLGLAICKGLIEAMGGEIGVVSTPGAGASFHFDIPAPAVARPVAEVEGQPADGLALDGLRVLVVDDNATNRELARVILGSVGARVTEAADGHAALDRATAEPFDLILMDIRMPGMDGITAMNRIRRGSSPNAAARILAFSADAEMPKLGAAGFDGYIRKPLVAATLIRAAMETAAIAGAGKPADCPAHADAARLTC